MEPLTLDRSKLFIEYNPIRTSFLDGLSPRNRIKWCELTKTNKQLCI